MKDIDKKELHQKLLKRVAADLEETMDIVFFLFAAFFILLIIIQ